MNLKFWKKSNDEELWLDKLGNIYFVLHKIDPPERAIGYVQAYLWKEIGGKLSSDRMIEDYKGFMRAIGVNND